MRLVANARMYAVTPSAAEHWRALLQWVIAQAEIDAEVIDHSPPAALDALWARPDLGCAFMCGYPLAQASPQPVILAAPVPSGVGYEHQPIYWTDLVVRDDSPIRSLEDAFGHRLAFTTEHSQSGYQSLRTFLAPYRPSGQSSLFSALVGPVMTPRRVAEAILNRDADIGPLDSYAHDLLRRYDPALTHDLRVVARTASTPIPPLVASAALPTHIIEALRSALLAIGDAHELSVHREALLLERFVPVPASAYTELATRAAEIDAGSYPELA